MDNDDEIISLSVGINYDYPIIMVDIIIIILEWFYFTLQFLVIRWDNDDESIDDMG